MLMKKNRLGYIFICVVLISACEEGLITPDPDRFNWPVSAPEVQDLDSGLLDSAAIAAKIMGYVDGLLVIRNGFLVTEKYFNGYGPFRPHNIKSVSKSFLSVVAGKALEQGFITSLDNKVLDYFPEYVHAGMDERKYDITIRHLLTMQMGIAAEADNNYQLYSEIYNSAKCNNTTLDLPLLFDPGNGMRYNTFETHLLSAIITKATGKSTRQYAQENIFNQMGVDVDQWETDPQGYYFGGNGMFFTPREMAVLGLLYLGQGKINGVRIVPSEWIGLTLTRTRPYDVGDWGVLTDYNYGYLWWLGRINGYTLYMALGYGGQTVLVFPQLEMIVVTTANPDIPPYVDQERPILELVSRYILPAVKYQLAE
jgi:CubicO group peptidase (beta-lactamase class C family)